MLHQGFIIDDKGIKNACWINHCNKKMLIKKEALSDLSERIFMFVRAACLTDVPGYNQQTSEPGQLPEPAPSDHP